MPINSFLYPGAKVTPAYEVANSLRFDSASNDSLSRTTGSSPTSTTKGTFSLWLKRSKLGANDRFITTNGVSDPYFQIYFDSNASRLNKIRLQVYDGGASKLELVTNQVFRDTSAWYNIILSYDSTPSTPSSSSIKLFINGTQVTSFQTETYPSQNQNHRFNEGVMRISSYDGSNDNSDAYMSEIVYCDGQALDADSFGEFDSDTNIWKPIDVSGLTFGAKGFYLDFEDSSALGDDVSGNNNDFTVNNLTSVDQSTDTCTNNFCTMNTLVPTSNVTFSQGNLKMVTDSSSSMGGSGIGTFGLNAGKWYWEIKIASLVANHNHGVISENTSELYTGATAMQNDTGVTCWRNDDGGEMVVDGSATSNDYGLFTDGQIMGIALDMDNYNISIYRNGSALVSDFNMSTTRGTIFPFINTGVNTTSEVNFGGTQSFTISSGNSDANGYGNFEYSVPSGYYSLCTKNLAEYG